MYKQAILYETQDEKDVVVNHDIGYMSWENVVKQMEPPEPVCAPQDAHYEVMCDNDFKIVDIIHYWKEIYEFSDDFVLTNPNLDMKGLMQIYYRNMKLEELETTENDDNWEHLWGDEDD